MRPLFRVLLVCALLSCGVSSLAQSHSGAKKMVFKHNDLADLSALRSAFNSLSNQPAYMAALYANHDGTIDLTDLGEFRNRFNVSVF